MPESRPTESRRRGPARGSAPVTSTIVDGGAAAASRPVSISRSMRSPSVRSTSSGSAVAGSPLRFALVAVSGRPHAAADRARHGVGRHADADASRCRRVTSRASAARRRRPGASAVPARTAPRAARPSPTAGPDARRPARRRRQSAAAPARRRAPSRRRRARPRRRENGSAARPYSVSVGTATMPPLRIHVAASSIASRCGASGSTNTRRIDALSALSAVGIVDCTGDSPAAAISAHVDEEHDADADVPPSSPATNGLLAMPTSDALVSTPKPVPCAPGGITLPAALYAAVIAAPMPMPNSADAAHITQMLPDTPSSREPRGRDRRAAGDDDARSESAAAACRRSDARARRCSAMIENRMPDDERHARVRDADLLDVERQHRPEAAVDELQPEDHDHHQDEVLEREDVAERHASGRRAAIAPGSCACDRAVVVHQEARARARRRRTPR